MYIKKRADFGKIFFGPGDRHPIMIQKHIRKGRMRFMRPGVRSFRKKALLQHVNVPLDAEIFEHLRPDRHAAFPQVGFAQQVHLSLIHI